MYPHQSFPAPYQGIAKIYSLFEHNNFDLKNPNKVSAVLGSFQNNNIELFHSLDETGYDFVTKQITTLDKINPQISARLIIPMTRYHNFNHKRKKIMKKYLKRIIKTNPSKDLFEIY